MRNRGSIPERGGEISLHHRRTLRPTQTSCSDRSSARGLKQQGGEAYKLPLANANVKNVWSYASISHWYSWHVAYLGTGIFLLTVHSTAEHRAPHRRRNYIKFARKVQIMKNTSSNKILLLFLLPLALQPTVGPGLSNNVLPFFHISHQLSQFLTPSS